MEFTIERFCKAGCYFIFHRYTAILVLYAQVAAELSIPNRDVLVDIFNGRLRRNDDNIDNRKFSKYKSGANEPGEELENGVGSAE